MSDSEAGEDGAVTAVALPEDAEAVMALRLVVGFVYLGRIYAKDAPPLPHGLTPHWIGLSQLVWSWMVPENKYKNLDDSEILLLGPKAIANRAGDQTFSRRMTLFADDYADVVTLPHWKVAFQELRLARVMVTMDVLDAVYLALIGNVDRTLSVLHQLTVSRDYRRFSSLLSPDISRVRLDSFLAGVLFFVNTTITTNEMDKRHTLTALKSVSGRRGETGDAFAGSIAAVTADFDLRRTKLLAGKRLVEWIGETYEVRRASVAAQREFRGIEQRRTETYTAAAAAQQTYRSAPPPPGPI